MEDVHIGVDRVFITAGFDQFRPDSGLADLVVLIQNDKDLVVILLGKARFLCHTLEDAAIVDHDGIALDADGIKEKGGHIDQLGFCGIGRIAENVDVTLGELTEASLLRSVGTPDRSGLQ